MTLSFISPSTLLPSKHQSLSNNKGLHKNTSSKFCKLSATAAKKILHMSVEYGGIQHAGVLVRNTIASKQFYMDVLGMSDDTALRNPKLPFDGAFLRAGASQIHLMELPNPDPLDGRPEHGGRDRHLAVTVKNLDPLIASLDKNNWTYTFSKSGRRALFTRDLDSNAIEFIEDPTSV